MTKTRRVGSFTAGLTLVLLGAALMVYTFFPNLQILEITLRFWPLSLILLGAELLLLSFRKEEIAVKVDFASVIMMLLVVGFAFCCEFARQYLLYNLR